MTGRESGAARKEGEIRWPFEKALTADERALILSRCSLKRYARGALVYDVGGARIGMMLLLTGTLRVCMSSSEGRRISLYRLSPGDVCVLTDEDVLPELSLDVTVEADQDSAAIILSGEDTGYLVRKNQAVALWAYRLLAKRYGDMVRALRRVMFWGLDRRVALSLLEAAGEDDGTLRITQEELSRDASSAREAVTRMLRRFAEQGFVRLHRGRIELTDRAALRALADNQAQKRG